MPRSAELHFMCDKSTKIDNSISKGQFFEDLRHRKTPCMAHGVCAYALRLRVGIWRVVRAEKSQNYRFFAKSNPPLALAL